MVDDEGRATESALTCDSAVRQDVWVSVNRGDGVAASGRSTRTAWAPSGGCTDAQITETLSRSGQLLKHHPPTHQHPRFDMYYECRSPRSLSLEEGNDPLFALLIHAMAAARLTARLLLLLTAVHVAYGQETISPTPSSESDAASSSPADTLSPSASLTPAPDTPSPSASTTGSLTSSSSLSSSVTPAPSPPAPVFSYSADAFEIVTGYDAYSPRFTTGACWGAPCACLPRSLPERECPGEGVGGGGASSRTGMPGGLEGVGGAGHLMCAAHGSAPALKGTQRHSHIHTRPVTCRPLR